MFTAIGLNVGAGMSMLGVNQHFKVLNIFNNSSFGIQTASERFSLTAGICTNEITEIPEVHADFVFANASTWQQLQTAVHYSVLNHIKIAILDITGILFEERFNVLATLTKAAFKEGYRTCYLSYSSKTFDTGFLETRVACVLYRKERNFNIAVPQLPAGMKNVHEYLLDYISSGLEKIQPDSTEYPIGGHYELTYDEHLCVQKLQHGWDLEMLAKYPEKAYGGSRVFLREFKESRKFRNLHRSSWPFKLQLSDYNRKYYIHPEKHRMFSIGELAKICGWFNIPLGPFPIEQIMYGTPFPVAKWLASLAEKYLQDKWGEKDYWIRYVEGTGEFIGGEANPLKPIKLVNILFYKPEAYNLEVTVKRKEPKTALDLDNLFYDL